MRCYGCSTKPLAFVAALSVVMLLGCGAGSDKKDNKASTEKAAPPLAVAIADITKEYKGDAGTADKKYKDKLIQFEGVVFTPPDARGDNSVIVLLKDPSATEPSPDLVRCIVVAAQKDKAMAMKSGQKVKAKGTCFGKDLSGTFVDVLNGELIEIAPGAK